MNQYFWWQILGGLGILGFGLLTHYEMIPQMVGLIGVVLSGCPIYVGHMMLRDEKLSQNPTRVKKKENINT